MYTNEKSPKKEQMNAMVSKTIICLTFSVFVVMHSRVKRIVLVYANPLAFPDQPMLPV